MRCQSDDSLQWCLQGAEADLGGGEEDERRDVRHPSPSRARRLSWSRRHGFPRRSRALGQPRVLRAATGRRRFPGRIQRKPGRPGVCRSIGVQGNGYFCVWISDTMSKMYWKSPEHVRTSTVFNCLFPSVIPEGQQGGCVVSVGEDSAQRWILFMLQWGNR